MTTPLAPVVSHILRRGKFTDVLLDYVRMHLASPVQLGDNEQPSAGGWTGEQPGTGQYTPWVSITTGPSTPNLTETLARRTGSSWRLVYFVRAAGGNRPQADYAADQARALLSALHHMVINDGHQNWKVQKTAYVTLGAIERNDATDPPTFELADTLEVWVEPT